MGIITMIFAAGLFALHKVSENTINERATIKAKSGRKYRTSKHRPKHHVEEDREDDKGEAQEHGIVMLDGTAVDSDLEPSAKSSTQSSSDTPAVSPIEPEHTAGSSVEVEGSEGQAQAIYEVSNLSHVYFTGSTGAAQ